MLFDALAPATTADPHRRRLRPQRHEVAGARAAPTPSCSSSAPSSTASRVLFLVESATPGLTVEADPAMGVRAAALTRLVLTDVRSPADALLGATDGTTYAECVRLSRLAWCALAVGTGQAVLDYVTPYVNEREAFGEPIAHRQSVAFMVANIAIELQAMRLVT